MCTLLSLLPGARRPAWHTKELAIASAHPHTQPATCPRSLQVWFWRWREPHRERVLARQPAVDAAKARVEELQARQEKLFSDAKAQLGLWSEAGVGESRQLFWWVLPHAVVLAGCSQCGGWWDRARHGRRHEAAIHAGRVLWRMGPAAPTIHCGGV